MFFGIFQLIGSFLSGPIATALLKGYTANLAARNTEQKISADLQQAEERIQANVVISEQNRWFPFVRWGFSFPFIAFNFKIICWDRMFHMGYTDPLTPDLIQLEMVIVAGYFGYAALAGFHKR